MVQTLTLFALLAPLSLSSVGFAQIDPFEPDEIVYVVRLGSGEMGRETVTFDADGWSAEGSFDFLGQRKGNYHAVIRHEDEGWIEFEFSTNDRGKDRSLIAAYGDGELMVEPAGAGEPRVTEVGGEDFFFYEDLLWATLIDLGRIFAHRDDAGKLPAGTKVTALSAAAGVGFPVEFIESERSEQVLDGQRIALRCFTFKVAGRVDFVMVCGPNGLPVRIEIPSQQIVVEAVGFEKLRSPGGEPTSIVDSGPWREDLSEVAHEVEIEKGVAITMRDGVELIADIYRPAVEGRFPAILSRTPYNRITEGALKGSWYAQRGYVFVAQDVRGRFDSGGDWFPFIHETDDGSDTLDWMAKRDWSDGKIGMIGASYVGLVQWLAAKSENPHLKCIVPQVSPPDPHENFPYEGGAFLMGAAWWAKVLDAMKQGTDWIQGTDWDKLYATLPLGDLDKNLGIKEETFLDTWLAHPPHDREFWEHACYQATFDKMTVPAFHISGWWDGDQPGAVQNYEGMRRSAKTKEARESQFLVMGPWTHFFNTERSIGHVDYGDEAMIDLDARILRFFDRYLKGIDNGIDREPPVHVFIMGSNSWSAEADWPLPQTQFTRLYLQSQGDCSQLDGDGRLALEPATGNDSTTYRYDPLDLPELDVDYTDLSGAQVTQDQSHQPDREDDLEFTSAPLSEACCILGPVTLVLWTSTDAKDTDYAASLTRLTKKGEMYVIRGGVQRLRYAADPQSDRPVPPGEIARVEIDLWATGLRLEKGDRLLVKVSSWAWPGYSRNLNTLEDQVDAESAVAANNTIYHGAEHQSHLLLPVIPREGSPGLFLQE